MLKIIADQLENKICMNNQGHFTENSIAAYFSNKKQKDNFS